MWKSLRKLSSEGGIYNNLGISVAATTIDAIIAAAISKLQPLPPFPLAAMPTQWWW